MVRDIARAGGGLPPAVAILITNLFLWHRATTATGRDISFFNVGMSFRRGLLLLIAGAGLYGHLRGGAPLLLLWLFLGFGLSAVALARIDEKARPAQSAGVPLPPRRIAQLALAIMATVAGAALLSSVFTQSAPRLSVPTVGAHLAADRTCAGRSCCVSRAAVGSALPMAGYDIEFAACRRRSAYPDRIWAGHSDGRPGSVVAAIALLVDGLAATRPCGGRADTGGGGYYRFPAPVARTGA